MRKVIISFLIVFLTLVSHTSFTCTGNTMLFHIMVFTCTKARRFNSPSTKNVAPVTYHALSEARSSTTFATSSAIATVPYVFS